VWGWCLDGNIGKTVLKTEYFLLMDEKEFKAQTKEFTHRYEKHSTQRHPFCHRERSEAI
jgi:hypothetical protein|tara:strand:- start:161 stop:337 length:177 start_codon:yes stop_codon:yes gene_type:complete